jgi:hypothetical protein
MEKEPKYDKIRGWLWLPAIALIAQPLDLFRKTILPLFESRLPNYRYEIDVPILIGDILLLVMVAVVAWLFFNRKRIAPIVFICYIIIVVLMWEIIDGMFEISREQPFIGMMIHTLVVLPYLLLSKRVKETFTEELNISIMIEKIFIPVSPVLITVYLRLRKMKYFVFLIAIFFLFFSVLLNCALLSLRIDGDLSHILDYL